MEQPAIRRGGAEDHISRLPDELLHTILVRLPSAAAAARTSVLSRRWRGVWAHMPELVLCGSPAPATPPSTPTPHLRSAASRSTSAESTRIAGKLRLRIDLKEDARRYRDVKEELALPICDRATEIHLRFLPEVFLRPPPTGSFSALTDLMISCGQMDGGELGRAVSSLQCPRLRKLYIYVPNLVPVCDVSTRVSRLQCHENRQVVGQRPNATRDFCESRC
ncbi:putative F-box/LRR-repeat protein At4g15060 [Miscanthus floridulus]|uniref:putative F-box/LRR-repeat protein At4g15060 n=1 Tax=Miscanthus floridulus TaxID=154761 RepID=UPI003457C199